MRHLPTGTVTFLFTDVEGSTRLLQELGERYAEVLAEHRRLLREAFGRHAGVEVDTQGDAFFYAFARASDALAAAEAGRRALEATPVQVRMGVHTGEPVVTDEGYVGMDVHKGARIAAAGHGGQVLVSEQAARLAASDALVDLGAHRLKDLTAPERIYQLGPGAFPPLKTLNATNLPVAASPLIGRERELADLVALLSDGVRVVTVTGAGGTGKTRFALQAAAELVEEFADGVFWVPLQSVADPELVLPTIAQTLGAKADVAAHIGGKRLLLLLDNLEQLLDAAPALAGLIAACPGLRLLVTSRAPLRVGGEHELPLEPLAEPEAVTLFVERARAAGRQLQPDATVAAICRRLDNLPLALELAAARTRLLAPDALLARLEHSLPLLTGGRRDVPQRQRTLRGAIAWSHDLLDEEARRLFARLAVFPGSFSLAAAEDVCEATLDALAALVELSLLKPVGEDRFLMLATIREYAAERLEETGEEADVGRRHATFFRELTLALPDADTIGYRGPASALAEDHANLRAAVEHALEHGELDSVAAVLRATWVYLTMVGALADGIRWAERVLAGSLSEELRDAVRLALSELMRFTGDLDRAAAVKLALLEAGAAGNSVAARWRRGLLADLCDIAVARGDLSAARRYAEQSVAEGGGARALASLGDVAMLEGALDEAERHMLEAERDLRERDYLEGLGWVLWSLGHLARRQGDSRLARRRLLEAAETFRTLGDPASVGDCLDGLALVLAESDDLDCAGRLLGAAESFRRATGRDRQAFPDLADPEVPESARREGAALSLDEALELARTSVD